MIPAEWWWKPFAKVYREGRSHRWNVTGCFPERVVLESWRESSASACNQSRRGKAGIGERRGVGDYRAGDVRRGDRVVNSVRVVAGRVGAHRQSCWNRRRCERRWDRGRDRGRDQAGRARGDQPGEQNLFFREGGRKLEKNREIEISRRNRTTYQEFHGEHFFFFFNKISKVFRAMDNCTVRTDWPGGLFIASFVPWIYSHYEHSFVRNVGSWHDATGSTLLHTGLLLLVLGHACRFTNASLKSS